MARQEFTVAQLTLLRVCRTVSAALSVLGSSVIIWHVVVRRRRGIQGNPKNRLLLGLSLSDLIFSLQTTVFTPVVYPLTHPGPLCSLDGWVHTVGNMAAYYNASLTFYFLAVIRWNVADRTFAKRYEPACHLLPLITALTGASTAVGLDLYNPKATGLGCWVEDYPLGCTEVNNPSVVLTSQCRGNAMLLKIYPLIAQVIPMVTAFAVMIVCNALIYRFVRALEQRNARYVLTTAPTTTNSSYSDPQAHSQQSVRSSMMSSVLNRVVRRNRSLRRSDPTYARSRKIATQSYYYVGAFFLSYSPGICFLIALAFVPEDDSRLFPLQVITQLLFPLQGGWNMLVYLRPQYLAWREATSNTGDDDQENGTTKHKGRWYAFYHAVKMTPPPQRRRQRCMAQPQEPQQPPTTNDDQHLLDPISTCATDTALNVSRSHHAQSGEQEGLSAIQALDAAVSGAFLSAPFHAPIGSSREHHDNMKPRRSCPEIPAFDDLPADDSQRHNNDSPGREMAKRQQSSDDTGAIGDPSANRIRDAVTTRSADELLPEEDDESGPNSNY